VHDFKLILGKQEVIQKRDSRKQEEEVLVRFFGCREVRAQKPRGRSISTLACSR
jgi:hypothetical protein